MLTLNQAKQELGINLVDTGDDTELSRNVRQIIARVRQITMRGIAWGCDKVTSVNSKARLRVIGHGFRTGQKIKAVGSGITAIDSAANHTITVIDRDTIELTVDGEMETGEFTIHPLTVELVTPISSDRLWLPEKITPCISIDLLEDLEEENTWTDIDDADYFTQPEDVRGHKIVEIIRTEGMFSLPISVRRGQYPLRRRTDKKTVRISVYQGADILPEEIIMAGTSLICDLWEKAGRGKDEKSFSFEDVQRQQLAGEEQMTCMIGPWSSLNTWLAR